MTHDPETVYNFLYRETNYGAISMVRHRTVVYMNFLHGNVPPPARILDIGCGRGPILKDCIYVGYEAEGTEISQHLLDNDLKDLPVKKCRCEDLHSYPTASFDVVIANDVLEHLPTIETVTTTVDNMARISRKWLLISCGLFSSTWVGLDGVELHPIQQNERWWKELMERYVEIVYRYVEDDYTLFIFGKKK